jgi:26S proteasome regulatory subunit N7
MFSILRIGLVFGELDLLRVDMEKARGLAEEGGDWERRNRLKVYDGVYLMSLREFKKASELFLTSIATFSSYELLSMREFVTYTVLMAMISVDRATLHDKVLQSPEILTYIRALPPLDVYATSLYECSYKELFESLGMYNDVPSLSKTMQNRLMSSSPYFCVVVTVC